MQTRTVARRISAPSPRPQGEVTLESGMPPGGWGAGKAAIGRLIRVSCRSM